MSELIKALELAAKHTDRDLDVQIPDQQNPQCWVSDFSVNLAPLDPEDEFLYLQADVAGNVDH